MFVLYENKRLGSRQMAPQHATGLMSSTSQFEVNVASCGYLLLTVLAGHRIGFLCSLRRAHLTRKHG